jgi:capsular polysaccharide biosynthesis protein
MPIIRVFDATRVDTPAPKVSPVEDQALLGWPHDYYMFPPIYIAQLGSAQIYGGTNLIFTEDSAICHDLYDFELDYSSEELHGRHIIDAKKNRVHLLRKDTNPTILPIAAAFVDACAPNYAHWLTEVLPRIAVFCSIEKYVDVPIIVDDGLHPNIMESLAVIAGKDREIIVLPTGKAISVDTLYMTSATGYVQFDQRHNGLTTNFHGVFSPQALELVRDLVLPFAEDLPHQEFPKKIYLRRTSMSRKVLNSKKIEEFLVDNGYVVVEPENLTFIQQVALFSKAESIIGPSGAALVNLVFSPPSSDFQILIGKSPATNYWYWHSMARSCENSVNYVFGKLLNDQGGIHADYTVDTRLIEDLHNVS